jgi:hypothetical protein
MGKKRRVFLCNIRQGKEPSRNLVVMARAKFS